MSPVPQRLQIRARKRLGSFDFDCDIDVPLTGLTALFGASGAGKSTLINLVAGLHRPDDGRVAIGTTVFCDRAAGIDLPVEKRQLGVVFQDARLFPHLTARQNLMYGFKRAGERARSPRATLDAVVQLLGLSALLDQRPHTLSGGEKQRVALGRALLAQPRLLLMDEPLASLDAARKAEVLPYIERLRDEYDVPILYVSHSLDEVLRLATTLVLIDHGRVVAAGPLAEVLGLPAARPFVGGGEAGALLFAAVQSHDERYALSTLACDGFTLRVPHLDAAIGTRLRVRIPAREVALALACPSDVSISNRIEGVIETCDAPASPSSPSPASGGGGGVSQRASGAPPERRAPASARLLEGWGQGSRQSAYAEVRVRVGPSTVLSATVTRESAERLALAPGLRVWCLVKSVALDAGALAVARGSVATPVALRQPANDERLRVDDWTR